MNDRDALLTELRDSREHAAALLKAKLEAMAGQVRELTNRMVSEIETVVPPDMEVLFPLASVERGLAAFESSIVERIESARPAVVAPPPPAKPAPAVVSAIPLEAIRKLDAGRAQSEILQEFLKQLAPWAGARAIVVFKEGQAMGWAGAGFGASDPVRSWRGAVSESPALAKVLEKTPVLLPVEGDALLAEWFAPRKGKLLLVPMMLRGKVVGTLMAAEGEAGLDVDAVQLITFLVGLLLETLAIRTQVPTATIVAPLDLTKQHVAAHVPAEEAVVFGAGEEEPVPVEEHTVPPEAMAEVQAGATVQLRTPIVPTPPPTVAPAVVAARPVAVAPPIPAAPAVSPAAPVAPVAAPPRSPEEQRKHDEAKRFARLLVSEIRLYNEQAVQEGKQTRDIYKRLKDDIDRSQDMYDQRIGADVRSSSDYFHAELVRILADGDADALGL